MSSEEPLSERDADILRALVALVELQDAMAQMIQAIAFPQRDEWSREDVALKRHTARTIIGELREKYDV